MNLQQIQKFSLAASCIGLLVTYIASGFVEPEFSRISDLRQEGSYVAIEALVVGSEKRDGNTFLTLRDETGEIKGLIWKSRRIEAPAKGSAVRATGFVRDYKGQLELEIEKLSAIESNSS